MRAVVAGPCISEFGWELMSWQGYVRAQAQGAAQVVVCSTDGLHGLYSDLNPIYIAHDIKGQRDCHKMNPCAEPHKLERAMRDLAGWEKMLQECGYEVTRLIPKGNENYTHDQQRFVAYGSAARAQSRGHRYDVVIHARNRDSSLPFGGANYPREEWEKIILPLVEEGYNIASIGLPSAALAIDGTDDLRGAPLEHIMDALAGAKLCVGPSSGPMHLASLCRTPHLVWTGDRYQAVIKATNMERYQTLWNPLKTRVRVIMKPMDQMPPAHSEILAAARDLLNG